MIRKYYFIILAAAVIMTAAFSISPAFAAGTDRGITISSGWDSGTADSADTFGDIVISYTNSLSSSSFYAHPDTPVSNTVSAVYGNTLPVSASPQSGNVGDTAWYVLLITNKSNGSDTIKLAIADTQYNGLSDTEVIITFWNSERSSRITMTSMLAEDAVETFYTAVYFRPSVQTSDSVIFTVSAIANAGAGGDSAGYTGANGIAYAGDGNDSVILTFNAISTSPNIRITKSVALINTNVVGYDGNPANVVPGSELEFTLRYDNDGDDSGANINIIAFIPDNTDFDTATNIMCSPDSNNISGLTIEFSNDGSTWNSIPPANTNRIRWTLANQVSPQNNDEGTDTLAGVDGDAIDFDAGILKYRVYVK